MSPFIREDVQLVPVKTHQQPLHKSSSCSSSFLRRTSPPMIVEGEEEEEPSSNDGGSITTQEPSCSDGASNTTQKLVPPISAGTTSFLPTCDVGRTKTLPPPRLPPAGRRHSRSVSDSNVTSTQRRAIFGQYWNTSGGVRGGVGGEGRLGSNTSSSSGISERSTSTVSQHQHQQRQQYPIGASAQHHLPSSTQPLVRSHIRSSSLPFFDNALEDLESKRDYRMYGPPKDHAERSSICQRYESVQDVPINLMLQSLPPLPSPLQRLCCSNGETRGVLQGMYPMMTPTPILRQSSYTLPQPVDLETDSSDTNTTPQSDLSPHKDPISTSTFNLSKSWQLEGKSSLSSLGELSGGETTTTTTATSCASSHSSSEVSSIDTMNNKIGLRFDPRVTVSEFDDPVERSWYSDDELDRLKHETIVLAQQYLMTYPHEAQRYNKIILDPVTGTHRKRALFSLPVLSMIDDSFKPTPEEYKKLIKTHVKSILIVDPNIAILDLLAKSMRAMFPNAKISKTQSGQEALHWVTESHPSNHVRFDIIIVEERLSGPPQQQQQHHPSSSQGGGGIQIVSLDEDLGRRFVGLRRAMSEQKGVVHPISSVVGGSSSEQQQQESLRMASGSHLLSLFHKHHTKEREGSVDKSADDKISPAMGRILAASCRTFETSSSSAGSMHSVDRKIQRQQQEQQPQHPPYPPLLIGISLHPENDTKIFQFAGADLVWGKPIPRVGETLRNHLLHVLLNKRRNVP